jgi:hypothetical protein
VLHDALVVEIRDAAGGLIRGATVRFAAVQPPGGQGAFVTLSGLGQRNFTSASFDVSSQFGLAATFVKLEGAAGTARVEIAVLNLGMTDTIGFVVKP